MAVIDREGAGNLILGGSDRQKSLTSQGNTFLFHSTQQLTSVGLEHLKMLFELTPRSSRALNLDAFRTLEIL